MSYIHSHICHSFFLVELSFHLASYSLRFFSVDLLLMGSIFSYFFFVQKVFILPSFWMTFLPSKFPWTTLLSNFEHIFFSFRALMVSFHRHSPAYIHIIVVFCSSVHNVSFSPGYLNFSSTLFFPFDYVRVGFFWCLACFVATWVSCIWGFMAFIKFGKYSVTFLLISFRPPSPLLFLGLPVPYAWHCPMGHRESVPFSSSLSWWIVSVFHYSFYCIF